MKRFPALFILLVILTSAMRAESPLGEAEDLIQDGLFKNTEEIHALSLNLTDPDRRYLINTYSKKAQIPGLVSLSLGLGAGSFMLGDTLGGWLGAAGDMFGLGLFAGFYISYGNTLRHNLSGQGERDPGYLALALAASSFTVIIGNRALQLGRTIFYADKYNAALRDSIGLR